MSVVDLLRDSIPNGSLLSGLVFGQKTKFVCTNLFQEESTSGEKRYVAEIQIVKTLSHQNYSVELPKRVRLEFLEEIALVKPRFLVSKSKIE